MCAANPEGSRSTYRAAKVNPDWSHHFVPRRFWFNKLMALTAAGGAAALATTDKRGLAFNAMKIGRQLDSKKGFVVTQWRRDQNNSRITGHSTRSSARGSRSGTNTAQTRQYDPRMNMHPVNFDDGCRHGTLLCNFSYHALPILELYFQGPFWMRIIREIIVSQMARRINEQIYLRWCE